MAKGTAFCTCAKCGKTFKVEKICYNRSDATQWEAWATDHYDECTDCYKARKAAEREAENAAAADAAKAQNFPELTGSAKQIAWANTIRQQITSEIKSKMPPCETWEKHHKDLWAWLLKKNSASWWIDRRPNYTHWDIGNAVREFAKETGWKPEQ